MFYKYYKFCLYNGMMLLSIVVHCQNYKYGVRAFIIIIICKAFCFTLHPYLLIFQKHHDDAKYNIKNISMIRLIIK